MLPSKPAVIVADGGWTSRIGTFGLAALAYLGLVLLARWTAGLAGGVAPIWLTTAFGIWLVLRLGPRIVPVIVAAGMVAYWLAARHLGQVAVVTLLSLARGAAALVGAWVWRLSADWRRRALGRFSETAGCVLVALVAPAVAAALGAAVSVRGGLRNSAHGLELALHWWAGDAIGVLFLLPLLLAWQELARRARGASRRDYARGLVVLAAMLAASGLVFFVPGGIKYLFVLFPVLLLATVWFDEPGTRLAALLIFATTTFAAVRGYGPFVSGDFWLNSLTLQLFFVAVGVVALILPVVHAGRNLLRRTSLVLLLAGWLLGGTMFAQMQRQEERANAADLATLSNAALRDLQDRLAAYLDVLRSSASFLMADPGLSREVWAEFARSLALPGRYPGHSGIWVVYPVAPADTASFLRRVRADGAPDFAIRTFAEAPGEAGERFVVTYVTPPAGNGPVLGLDLATDPTRRRAAEAARDTGQPVISDRITLQQDPLHSPAFLLFLPVYRQGAALETVADRRRALLAWVYAPFEPEVFVRGVLGSQLAKLQLAFYEAGPLDAAHLIFSTATLAPGPPKFARVTTLAVGGRNFQLAWNPGPDFVPDSQSLLVWLTLSFAVVAVLVAEFALGLETFREEAETLARLRLQAQQESEGRFRAVFEQVALGVVLVDLATGRYLRANRQFGAILGYAEEEIARLTIRDVTHPDDVAKSEDAVRRLRAREISNFTFDKRYRRKDGRTIWVRLTVSRLALADTPGDFSIGTLEDITDRREAEEALRLNEFSVRESSVPTFWIGSDGRILRANPAVSAMLGYSESEVLKLSVPDLDPDFGWDRWPGHWQELRREGRMRFETRHRHKLGHLVPVEVNLTWFEFNGREYNFAFARDISERRRRDRERSNEMIILEALARGDPVREVLDRLVANFEEQLPGMRGSVLLLGPDGRHLRRGVAPRLPEDYCRAIDGMEIGPGAGSCGTAAHANCTVMVDDIASDPLWKDFRTLALGHGLRACWSVPIRGAGDRVLGTFAFYAAQPRAATALELFTLERGAHLASLALERERAELNLRESEEKFRSYVEQASGALYVHDLSGRFVDVNQRACASLGYSREELLGMGVRDVAVDFDLAEVQEIWRGVTQGQTLLLNRRHRRKDGTIFPVEIQFASFTLKGERLFMGLVRDITETKKAEEERQSLERQLRQSQKLEAMGTLAGGIAHDFNNVLTGIFGYTAMASRVAGDNSDLRELLGEINRAGRRAADLVRQILAFSRAPGGDEAVGPVQLDEVVTEAVKLLRATTPALVEFEVRLAPALPPVLGNASQLHQVLMNLGTNAVQAMEGGAGRLLIRLDALTTEEAAAAAPAGLPAGPGVRLTVTDTGRGMDPATQERVFEPFFTTKAPGEGTGLGLSVVHGIVRGHRGAIRLASELGRGSTFEIFLPATAAPPQPEDEPPAVEVLPLGHGERVLFVDDEQQIASVGKMILDQLGYVTESESEVLRALARVEADPAAYQLVVSDQTMPEMTGLEFARRIHALRPDLPVVLTSGHSVDLTPERVNEVGVREVLAKPYTTEQLARAIARNLPGGGQG